jgi:hypothetical protein
LRIEATKTSWRHLAASAAVNVAPSESVPVVFLKYSFIGITAGVFQVRSVTRRKTRFPRLKIIKVSTVVAARLRIPKEASKEEKSGKTFDWCAAKASEIARSAPQRRPADGATALGRVRFYR